MDIQAAAKAKVGKRKDFIKTEEKYIQIPLFGLKILLTLTMSQCIMTISGIKLMVIILFGVKWTQAAFV
jgi:hypothetical protein